MINQAGHLAVTNIGSVTSPGPFFSIYFSNSTIPFSDMTFACRVLDSDIFVLGKPRHPSWCFTQRCRYSGSVRRGGRGVGRRLTRS
ncbi:hypothetical protein M404DRAFT_360401 [Pisolithus tinctorius Marx 270]|uniref:Uncharacterized protein n=1 Tax=Pisolithus tinctorius Marx 270 TaxID=870435 RepID=A0A0C3P5P5_PISTI|nr:hypothetical protein M404DRAFT_360401 [Pisolithus tinctorius Marx 270]